VPHLNTEAHRVSVWCECREGKEMDIVCDLAALTDSSDEEDVDPSPVTQSKKRRTHRNQHRNEQQRQKQRNEPQNKEQ
jgi:hypothetical protein